MKLPPLNVLVPVVGLVYFGLFLGIFVLSALVTGTFASFMYIFIIYAAASLVTALAIWRGVRFSFLLGIIVSTVIAVTLALAPKPNGLVDVLSNPALTGEFINRITSFPPLLAVLAYSILGVREERARHGEAKAVLPVRMIPGTSVISTPTVGFILGGLVVGLLAGATLSSLASTSGTPADIVIVQGARAQPTGSSTSPELSRSKSV